MRGCDDVLRSRGTRDSSLDSLARMTLMLNFDEEVLAAGPCRPA